LSRLSEVARCPNLRHIAVGSPVGADLGPRGHEMASVLASFPLLERLEVRRVHHTRPERYLSPSSPQLLVFRVSWSHDAVTDRTLEALPDLVPNLHSLEMPNCSPDLSEAGLKHIHRLQHLRRLDLLGQRITEDGLKALHGSQLNYLRLGLGARLAQVTPTDIAAAAVACPNLTDLVLCSNLRLQCWQKDFCNELVKELLERLPADRDLTLHVHEDMLQDLPSGPLHMADQTYGNYQVFDDDIDYRDLQDFQEHWAKIINCSCCTQLPPSDLVFADMDFGESDIEGIDFGESDSE